jgi:hypothetical protein
LRAALLQQLQGNQGIQQSRHATLVGTAQLRQLCGRERFRSQATKNVEVHAGGQHASRLVAAEHFEQRLGRPSTSHQ